MKTRWISLLLCLAMVFSFFTALTSSAGAVTGNDLAADDTYTVIAATEGAQTTGESTWSYWGTQTATCTFIPRYQISITVLDGKITDITASVLPGTGSSTAISDNSRYTVITTSNNGSGRNAAITNSVTDARNSASSALNTALSNFDSLKGGTVEATLQNVQSFTPFVTNANTTAIKNAIIAAIQSADSQLRDGEEYIYTSVTMPEGGWKTDSDYGDQQLYAYVEKGDGNGYEYVPVKVNEGTIYGKATDANGNVKTDWTATSANEAYKRHGSLYYKDSLNYEDVYVDKITKYTYFGTGDEINIGDSAYFRHNYNVTSDGDYWASAFFIYVPNNASHSEPDGNMGCWHQVYYKCRGITGVGYRYTFYYYTNKYSNNNGSVNVEDEDRDFHSGKKGDVIGSGDKQIKLLSDYEGPRCSGTHLGGGIYVVTTPFTTDLDFYIGDGQSTEFNYLFTDNRVLACPEPNSTGSHEYVGNLYYSQNGVIKLLNQDTNEPLPNSSSSNEIGAVLYEGPLYTKTIGTNGEFGGEKKLSSRNDDGSFDLTIDSWATGSYQGETEAVIPGQSSGGDEPGSEIVKRVTAKQPLDIVLVLDQSGSMATPDMDESKQAVSTGKTEWTLSELESGAYYYNVNGKMYPVKLGQGTIYSESTSKIASWMFGYGHDGISVAVNGAPVYYNVSTNHFIKYDADGDGQDEMHRIFMVTSGLFLHYGLYPYVYNDPNDDYTKKSQWTDNHYWVAIFNPWTAKKLRNNDQWNTLTDGNGGENSRISYINKNGQTTGATDADGDNAKLSYS